MPNVGPFAVVRCEKKAVCCKDSALTDEHFVHEKDRFFQKIFPGCV